MPKKIWSHFVPLPSTTAPSLPFFLSFISLLSFSFLNLPFCSYDCLLSHFFTCFHSYILFLYFSVFILSPFLSFFILLCHSFHHLPPHCYPSGVTFAVSIFKQQVHQNTSAKASELSLSIGRRIPF